MMSSLTNSVSPIETCPKTFIADLFCTRLKFVFVRCTREHRTCYISYLGLGDGQKQYYVRFNRARYLGKTRHYSTETPPRLGTHI